MLRHLHNGAAAELHCSLIYVITYRSLTLTCMFSKTWLDYVLFCVCLWGGYRDLGVITSPEQLLPEFYSEHQLEGKRAARVIFWLAGNSCNEPKRVPIIPLAIKKEEEITSLFFFSLTFSTLTSFDGGREGRDCWRAADHFCPDCLTVAS